jgi:shikimate dehydrogenase
MSAPVSFAGVVGWPISQSVSPTMHNFWIAQYGLDAEYIPLAVKPEDFAEVMARLPEKGFAGVNVTIPHKEAAFKLSTTLDTNARAAGAVNLLVFDQGKIHGRNTDIPGFSAALTESFGPGIARAAPVVVLGAGGAARAVVLALIHQGAFDIRILNRTETPARNLIDLVQDKGAKLSAPDWGDWNAAFEGAGLLVNTTSLGMIGKDALHIPLEHLPRGAAVADIVYNPLETALLADARARGHRTMDGLGMLMHQAVPAFAAWFGVTPQVTPDLRAVLEEKLRGVKP